MSNIIYQAVAVGGRHDQATLPSNMMCLPPTWMAYSNDQGGHDPVCAIKYRVSGPINHANGRNMPCALCEATG